MSKEWSEGAAIAKRRWHPLKRLFERYGVVLEEGEYEAMLRQVTKKQVVLKGIHNKRRLYEVTVPSTGTVVPIVYSKRSGDFITVLAEGQTFGYSSQKQD